MQQDIETIQFGTHYILDGYGANPEILKDKAFLKKMLTSLVTEMHMHTITDPVVVEVGEKNTKDPGGVSGFVMIAESHISFHTFPKRGFVTIDVYTCQNNLDTDTLTKKLTDSFSLQDVDAQVIARGTKYPTKNLY
jgi:S-adenosylmethionine decarboxylase